MATGLEDNFLLQHALDRVESVRRFLDRRPQAATDGAALEGMISVALELPDLLRKGWRVALEGLFPPGEEFGSVSDLEETRQLVRRAFYESGEMIEAVRQRRRTGKRNPERRCRGRTASARPWTRFAEWKKTSSATGRPSPSRSRRKAKRLCPWKRRSLGCGE
jgi:hypothetical protein